MGYGTCPRARTEWQSGFTPKLEPALLQGRLMPSCSPSRLPLGHPSRGDIGEPGMNPDREDVTLVTWTRKQFGPPMTVARGKDRGRVAAVGTGWGHSEARAVRAQRTQLCPSLEPDPHVSLSEASVSPMLRDPPG